MSSPEHSRSLPRVEESDLLSLVAEEVEDPAHTEWWDRFAGENPVLAREVLRRAYYDTLPPSSTSSLEIQRRIVNSVSFAIQALRSAAERIRQESETADSGVEASLGGGGGEVRQP